MFTKLTEQLKANPKTIVFTEGTDPRIQDAAAKLTAEGILNVILLGNPDAVKLTAADAKYDISKCEIIDPARYADKDAMVEKMVELRKGKMTEEQVRDKGAGRVRLHRRADVNGNAHTPGWRHRVLVQHVGAHIRKLPYILPGTTLHNDSSKNPCRCPAVYACQGFVRDKNS